MAQPIDGAVLLELWERGLSLAASATDGARADAVLAADGAPPPATLGDRNRRLVERHCALFGRELALVSRCPSCGEAVEFEADALEIAAELETAGGAGSHRLEWDGHAISFRLPSAADVDDAGAASSDDDDGFGRRLLQRCVLSARRLGHDGAEGGRDDGDDNGARVAFDALPPAALDAVSARMEQIDPAAGLAFTLACPGCATGWSARLDLGQLLWRKLRAAAEALLLDVDALARAYGWSERDVLRLTPLRRAAYLQMVAA